MRMVSGLGVLLGLVASGGAHAALYSQTADHDTWVGYRQNGNIDFGNRNGDAGIESQGGLDEVARQQRILLRWDLSSIPAGSTVNSAVVQIRGGRLFSSLNGGTQTVPGLVELRHIVPGNAWNETAATWATRDGTNPWSGGIGAAPAGTLVGTGGALSNTVWDTYSYAANLFNVPIPDAPFDMDVQGLAQQWVNGSLENNGVSLELGAGLSGLNTPDLYVFLTYSADVGTTTNLAPLLIIDYTEVPEPAGIMALGGTMALFMGRRFRSAKKILTRRG